MSDLTFQMLLQCHYTGDDNDIDKLHAEHLVDDNWEEFNINNYTPGFDTFMYAIICCQHMYFRMNAAKYGLVMSSSEGLITVITNKHRSIDTLNVEFKGKLRKGTVTSDAVNSITARMALCPVSINLKDIPNNHIAADFELT